MISRPIRLVAVLMTVALFTLAACSDDTGDSAATTTLTSSPTTTPATTEAGGDAPSTSGSATSATAPAPTATSTTVPPPVLLGAGLEPVEIARGGDAPGHLTAVEATSPDGNDQVTFTFDSPTAPGATIRYVEGPITKDPSDLPVQVEGSAFLQVVLSPASQGPPGAPTPTVTGTHNVVDVVPTGDFEAVVTWVIGAKERRPFRARALTDPPRIVIDIAA